MKEKTKENTINDTYAEINLRALRKNFDIIKQKSKHTKKAGDENVKVCSIVKANGYGHGMLKVSEELIKHGTNYLGTADYSESIKLSDYLRKKRIKQVPILCFGNLSEDKKYFEEIVSKNIEITISDIKIAKAVNNFAKSVSKKIAIHIHVDTGMNRVGFQEKGIPEAVRKLKGLNNLKIKGIYSHYATSEIPDNSYALKQLRTFKEIIKEIENNVLKIELKHMENTGGIVNYRDGIFNMVRPGISLYGYYPDRKFVDKDINLLPVMTLKSKVSFVKELEKSKSISYGRKYFTKHRTQIASIPIGYGDGYSKILSNKSKVCIKKRFYNVVGAVCMDWIMVDLNGNKSGVKVNDEVILMGKEYPAYNLSEIMKTIPYEVTCNVSSRVQRVYVE
jgi:alanine racemase